VASAVEYADRWVGYQQRHLRVPGVTVAVRLRGDLLLSSAYGLADVEAAAPMRTSSAFRIASNSKSFTATLVAQLVEQGLLRYDDRLDQHLPWLPAAADALRGVTLRELLAHSSGIFRDGELADFWQVDGDFPDEATFRSWITDRARVLPGNAQLKYSNVGYALLGQVVEAVAGRSYADLVRTGILAPLGLADTSPELDAHAAARLATGYSSRRYGMGRVAFPHLDTQAYAPATGVCATAEDVSTFADAHCLGAPGLLSDESKRLLQQPQWDISGEDTRYGMGFMCFEVGGRQLVGHGGGFPGFITAMRFDPKERLVVVVLTNAVDGPAGELATGILKLVDAAHDGGDDLVDEVSDRFTGRFFCLWGTIDIVRLGQRLVAIDPDRPDPTDHLSILRPAGPDELEIVSTSGLRYPGERVRYTFAGDGAARSIRFGPQVMQSWTEFQATPYAGPPEP